MITIRLATLADRDQALHLLNQLGSVVNEVVKFDPDNVRAHELGFQNFEQALSRDDRKIFVVEQDSQLIGVATYFLFNDFITGRPFVHMDDFVIDSKCRGKGIGTQLLIYVKQYAKDHGVTTLQLTSSLPLIRAHKFYEKNGGFFARKVIKFEL